MSFKIVAPFKPTGDQPTAIRKLSSGIINGDKSQVLLGVTGSGKTYTIANVIQEVQRPTLVLAHNKIVDKIYLLILSLMGVFFVSVGFYSFHQELAMNYNVLLFSPLLLILIL